jgi:hypothetical protein
MAEIQSAVQLDISDSLRLYKTPISLSQSVVSRQTVRFNTTGSTAFNQNNRAISIRLSSQEYLDPTSAFLCFNYKADNLGTVPQDCILSLFSDARLIIGGRVVESIQNVSELMPSVFIGKTPAEAIRSAYGALAGVDRFTTEKHGFCQIGDGSVAAGQDTASLAPVRLGTLSTVPGFDTGTANFVPNQSTTSAIDQVTKNSSNLLHAYGYTSCSGLTKKFFTSSNLDVNSGFINGIQTGSRYYAIPLHSLFGLFSTSQFWCLRNMGVVTVELSLHPTRGVQNIYTKAQTALVGSPVVAFQPPTDADAVKLATGYCGYNLSNVFVYADIVQPNASIVQKIDELVMGSSGVSMIYDTWSTSAFNVGYQTNLQLQVSRSFSHVRDLVMVARPVDAVSSPFARQDNTYLGSRMRSYRTSVGSSSFPAIEVDNIQLALLECLKSYGHHTGATSSVIDLSNYTGATGVSHVASCYTGCLENLGVIRGGGADALIQSSATHTTPNSTFQICQSFSRLLGEGQHQMLSGISTRLSGSIMTLNLQLFEYKNGTAISEITSSLNKGSVDCILGNSPLNIVIGVHSEQLLRIADSSVMVSD